MFGFPAQDRNLLITNHASLSLMMGRCKYSNERKQTETRVHECDKKKVHKA